MWIPNYINAQIQKQVHINIRAELALHLRPMTGEQTKTHPHNSPKTWRFWPEFSEARHIWIGTINASLRKRATRRQCGIWDQIRFYTWSPFQNKWLKCLKQNMGWSHWVKSTVVWDHLYSVKSNSMLFWYFYLKLGRIYSYYWHLY